MSEEKIKENLREYFWSHHLDDMKPEELAEKVYLMCVSAENPRIAALESDLEYLNRWKTLIESAPEFEVQKIAVERFLKTDGMRPFLAHFKTRIKELETENERLSAEVEKWKRLAGKKAI